MQLNTIKQMRYCGQALLAARIHGTAVGPLQVGSAHGPALLSMFKHLSQLTY